MLRLLNDCTRPGYPSEYLVSRIHGRMKASASSAEGSRGGTNTFVADDEKIWGEASRERRWIYVQMNGSLREIFAPLLFYYELNTLIASLRGLEASMSQSVNVDLEQSLLNEGIRKIVQAISTPEEVVANLERYLEGSPLDMAGMTLAYQEGGGQKCEELIRRKFLEQTTKISNNLEVVTFFRMMIDLKNTLTMAKYVRWKKREAPVLIEGGYLRLRKTDQALFKQYLGSMARRFAGGRELADAKLHPVMLELLLHEWFTKKMRQLMQSLSPVQCCIGYLWHCFASAKKRSGEFHAVRFVENFPGVEGGVQ